MWVSNRAIILLTCLAEWCTRIVQSHHTCGRMEAVLHETGSNCSTPLKFTSSNRDENLYYIYELSEAINPENNVLVTCTPQDRAHSAIICEQIDN